MLLLAIQYNYVLNGRLCDAALHVKVAQYFMSYVYNNIRRHTVKLLDPACFELAINLNQYIQFFR